MGAVIDMQAASERAKYEKTWAADNYRQTCHGLMLWKTKRWLFPVKPKSGLDIGCGTGRLIEQWQQEHIFGYGIDIADNAADERIKPYVLVANLWEDGLTAAMTRFDMGCCADVMEHIPPDRVTQVLENIHTVCSVVVYKIANFPSIHEGRQLHLTLRPRQWWKNQLEAFGNVTETEGRFGVEEYIFRVDSFR